MEYNKRNFKKANDKKVLHKVRKHWVVVSMALLMAMGGKAVLTHVNASANNLNNNDQKSQVNQNHTASAELLNQSSSANQQSASNLNQSSSANSLKPNQIVNRANELHQRILTNASNNHSNNGLSTQNHENLGSSNDKAEDTRAIHQMDNNALNAKWARITLSKLPQTQQTPQSLKHIKSVQHNRNVTAYHVAKHMLGDANNLNNGPSDQSKVTFRWFLVFNNSDIDNAQIIGNFTYMNAPGAPIADVIRGQEFDPMIPQSYQSEGVHFDSDVKGTNHGLLFDSPYDGNKSATESMPSSFPAGNHTIDVYLTKPETSMILIEYDNMAANGQAISSAEQTNENYAGQPFTWSANDANVPKNFQLDHVANAIPNSYPSGGNPYVIHVDVRPKDDTVNGTIEYVDSDTHQSIGTVPISGKNGSKIPSDIYSDDLKLLPNNVGVDYNFVGTSPANGQDYVNNEKLVAYVAKTAGQPITIHYMNNNQRMGKPYTISGQIGKSGNLISNTDPIPTGYTLSSSDASDATAQYTITGKPQSDYINVVGKQETPTLKVNIHKEGASNSSDVKNVRLSGQVGQQIDVHPSDYRPSDYEEDTSNNRDQVVTTTITPNGTLSPSSVDFYYTEPASKQAGTITFNYINQHKVSVGTKTVNGHSGQKYNSNQIGVPAGYKLASDENNKTYVMNNGSQTIPVYVNGNEISANFTIRRETENSDLIGKPITVPIVGAEVGNTVTVQPSSVKIPNNYKIDPKDSAVSVTVSPNGISPTSATFYYLQNKGTVTINYVNNGNIVKSYQLNGDVNNTQHNYVSKADPIPSGFELAKSGDRVAVFTYHSNPQTINIPVKGTLVNPTLTVNQRIHDYNGKSTVNPISKVLKNHHIGDRITINPNQYLPGNQKPGTSPVYYVDSKMPKSTNLVVLSNGQLGQLNSDGQLIPGNVNYDYDETGPVTVRYINSENKLVAQSKPYYGTYGSTVYSTNIMPMPAGYVGNGGTDSAVVSNSPKVITEYVQGIDQSDALNVNIQVKSNGSIVPSKSKSIKVPVSTQVGSDQTIVPSDYRPSNTSSDTYTVDPADKTVPVVMEYNGTTKRSYLNPGSVTFTYDEQSSSNSQSSSSTSPSGSSAAKSASSKASSSVTPSSGQAPQSSGFTPSSSTVPQSSGSVQPSNTPSSASSSATPSSGQAPQSSGSTPSSSTAPQSSGSMQPRNKPSSTSSSATPSSGEAPKSSGSTPSSSTAPQSSGSMQPSNKPSNTSSSATPSSGEVPQSSGSTPSSSTAPQSGSSSSSHPNDNVTSYILFRDPNGNAMQLYSDTGNEGSVIDYQYYIGLFNEDHSLQNGYYNYSVNSSDSKTIEPNQFDTVTVSTSTNPRSGGSAQPSNSTNNGSSATPSSGQAPQSSGSTPSSSTAPQSSNVQPVNPSNTGSSVAPSSGSTSSASNGSQSNGNSQHNNSTNTSNGQSSGSSNNTASSSGSTSSASNSSQSNGNSQHNNSTNTSNGQSSGSSSNSQPNNNVTSYILFRDPNGNAMQLYSDTGNEGSVIDYQYYIDLFNVDHSLQNGYYTYSVNSSDSKTIEPNRFDTITVSPVYNGSAGSQSTSSASVPASQSSLPISQSTAPESSNVEPNSTTSRNTGSTPTPSSEAPSYNHQTSGYNSRTPENDTRSTRTPGDVGYRSSTPVANPQQNNEQSPMISPAYRDRLDALNNDLNGRYSHYNNNAVKNRSKLPQTGESHGNATQIGVILMALALSFGALDAAVADRRRRDND